MPKRIVFLTGTRADFGKLKSLMQRLEDHEDFEVQIFVTGMHMLRRYGYTCAEVERSGFQNIFKYINQNTSDAMDVVLAKTIHGFSDYVKEIQPDMIVVHGDRVEALAGAIVGSLNNVLVSHIEGGEVSGTIDEVIRHAVSKMSHLHFVANDDAKRRLLQLGERATSTHVIGSPDIDIMASPDLPPLSEALAHYEVDYEKFGIVLFHPVTTELESLERDAASFVDALLASEGNYVVVFPNNDHGSQIIQRAYRRFDGNPRFRVFPSIRFEYFLVMMKAADFMIGNSSAGIREAPFFGVPSINLGSRQMNRAEAPSIQNIGYEEAAILSAIRDVDEYRGAASADFGAGDSDRRFVEVLEEEATWTCATQKHFVDLV